VTPIQRAAYLAHWRTASMRRRVAEARAILDKAASIGRVVVSMSWGKDSTVVGHLALQYLASPVAMLHLASGAHLPGFEPVQAYFAEQADLHIIEPRYTLEQTIAWLRDVGLPHERTHAQQRAVVKAIKKDVGTEWCRTHGFGVQIMGIRADESTTRRTFLRAKGAIYAARGITIACPIAWWTAKDVWAYIVAHDLPYHPLYDCETHGETRETLRNTGWLATDGAEYGRIAWLREHYPEQYAALVRHFDQVRRYT
jgi:3'-phosphoadenosine 5'-phosphosulfate sulfotransferase (PAPS reductase)/FAD synthetase